MKKLLEVCVDSLASARAAQAGGADRLEFCSALAVGGLSPYPELLRQIKAECSLPVRCLMRPRAGDFLYTKDEIDLLCAQIHTLRDTGADGFVIGALTPMARWTSPPWPNCWMPAGICPSRCTAALMFPAIWRKPIVTPPHWVLIRS